MDKKLKTSKDIFNDVLKRYENLEFDNAKTNIDKLKQQLKAVSTKQRNTVKKQAYYLVESGEFLISNYDMENYLNNTVYGKNKDNKVNTFKRYCLLVSNAIELGLINNRKVEK